MRWLATLALFLTIAVAAHAADRAAGIPHIRVGVSYDAARLQLVRAGFRPVPFRTRPSEGLCGEGDGDVCRQAPEVYDGSSGGLAYLRFLFVRRRDGRFLTVQALDEPRMRFAGAKWTAPFEYDWLTAKDHGYRTGGYKTVDPHDMVLLRAAAKRYAPPEKPEPEPVLPLCRDAPPHTACWVKPPANWKPPPKR